MCSLRLSGERGAGRGAGLRAPGHAIRPLLVLPEGTKRATSVNVRLPCLQKDLRTGSISRGIVDFPSELCRHRSGMCTEVARLVPQNKFMQRARCRSQTQASAYIILYDVTLYVIL